MITSRMTGLRSTGSTVFTPWCFSYLARAHAEAGQFDDAWRCIGEAMCEADIHRVGGEIALEPGKGSFPGSAASNVLPVIQELRAKNVAVISINPEGDKPLS